MKILITGGQGNLGLWLVEHFLAHNHEVHVLGRDKKVENSHPNYRFLAADITNLSILTSVITERYDWCIHTASYNEHFHEGYAEKALLINAGGTRNLCDALSVHGVGKLVYFSTIHVYGLNVPYVDELSPVNPANHYGLTHYFAEKYIEHFCRKEGIAYSICRLSNSYGCPKLPDTDKWYLIFNDFCRQAHENGQIVLQSNGLLYRDFIWIGDVVNVVDRLLNSNGLGNGIVNLSSGTSISLYDLALLVIEAYNDFIGMSKGKVIINGEDKNSYPKVVFENEKLLSIFPMKFNSRHKEEANEIFSLLNVPIK
ncbi:NAD-dependent epimerase/dehydratase family protein [Thaumasiovibrio subtropicus]|uniref:NAD-dependent epimerase/dehydratase family protein n=1 Tax=Thaumasiovibrio subtropicus TaxID=1891207 RepID=UPI000B363994|nr:NAD(P)-dependent oxidoreductase [Thaumasiovibrio subtropicus]